MIALFKKPRQGVLTPDQQTYNYHVSKVSFQTLDLITVLIVGQVCIHSEHAIRLLKGCFQALQELCVLISSTRHHTWAILFAQCCLILHNLIIHIEEDSFDSIFREELCRTGRDDQAEALKGEQQDETSDEDKDPDLCCAC